MKLRLRIYYSQCAKVHSNAKERSHAKQVSVAQRSVTAQSKHKIFTFFENTKQPGGLSRFCQSSVRFPGSGRLGKTILFTVRTSSVRSIDWSIRRYWRDKFGQFFFAPASAARSAFNENFIRYAYALLNFDLTLEVNSARCSEIRNGGLHNGADMRKCCRKGALFGFSRRFEKRLWFTSGFILCRSRVLSVYDGICDTWTFRDLSIVRLNLVCVL